MVFATWAGKPGLPLQVISEITIGSYYFGRERLAEIARLEHKKRGITYELAHRYLSQHIRYELGPRELLGLSTFLELADFRPASLAAMSSCND
jgi:predicted solute-binding protein